MKNLERIYIISWFGSKDNPDLIDKRKAFHEKQVKWAKEQNLSVFVYQQEYENDWYIDDVNYINQTNTRCFPGEARDGCLKHFYDSDSDFAIFADNDSILKEAIPEISFIDTFNKKSLKDLKLVDLIMPVNPIWTPFKKDIEDNEQEYRTKLMFNRNPSLKGSLFLIRNVKKYYDLEIYNDQEFFIDDEGQMVSGEDQDFGLQFLANGLSCYCCKNIILEEYAIQKSKSTWAKEVRSSSYREGKFLIAKKYNMKVCYTKYRYVGFNGKKLGFSDTINFDQYWILPKPMTIDEMKTYFEEADYFNYPELEKALSKKKPKIRLDYKKVYEKSNKPSKLEIPINNHLDGFFTY